MNKLILIFLVFVSLTAQAYEPLIREDRVWEYCIEQVSPDHSDSFILNFKFDGTEWINNNTYHKLNCWYEDVENPIPETVAYMREENGAVYRLLQQDEITIYGNGDGLSFPVNENQEICLYQFGKMDYDEPAKQPLSIAGIIDCFGCNDVNAKLAILPLAPIYTKIQSKDKNWNVSLFYSQETNNFITERWLNGDSSDDIFCITIVEGVGNVGRGFLHTPGFLDMMIANYYSNAYFVRQKDLYGNTVFDAKWLKDQSGVTDVVPQERPRDGKSYDLTGKQVTDPEPGTIYIRDGEKHIAR